MRLGAWVSRGAMFSMLARDACVVRGCGRAAPRKPYRVRAYGQYYSNLTRRGLEALEFHLKFHEIEFHEIEFHEIS